MIIVKASVWEYLGTLSCILSSLKIFKISAKTFENNGNSITKNIVKLKLEQNIKSLLYNPLICIVQRNQIFELYDKPAR